MLNIYSYNKLGNVVCETASGVWNDIIWHVRGEYEGLILPAATQPVVLQPSALSLPPSPFYLQP